MEIDGINYTEYLLTNNPDNLVESNIHYTLLVQDDDELAISKIIDITSPTENYRLSEKDNIAIIRVFGKKGETLRSYHYSDKTYLELENESEIAQTNSRKFAMDRGYIYIETERWTDWYHNSGNGLSKTHSTFEGLTREVIFSNTSGYSSYQGYPTFERGGGAYDSNIGANYDGKLSLEERTIEKITERTSVDKIYNNLEGKADCVYQKMVDNKNNINWILENFNDGDTPSQFNLKLVMSTTLGNETNASTIKSGNTFIIKINANTLSSRTTLGLARTVIHEGIHARLREFLFRKGGTVSKNDFPGVYEYYRIYQDNWDHQQMADFYRGTIAKGLKQFDNGQHTDQFYDDMAWEGLANIVDANNRPNEIYTEAWKKLTDTEQNRIKNTIANEKSNGNKTCVK